MNDENKKIIIRTLNDIDLCKNQDIIIELLLDIYKINFPGCDNLEEVAKESFINMIRYTNDKTAIIIGAYLDQELIGFLWGYQRELMNETRIHVSQIVIHSNHRGKGIGTLLLNKIEDIAVSKKIYCIDLLATLDNETAVQFYKSKGYQMTRVQFEKKLL